MIQAKTWDKVVATTIDESIVQKLPIRIDSFLLSPISGTNKGLGHNCTRSPTTLQSMMTLNKDAGVACAPLDAATFAGIVPACTTSMSLADLLSSPSWSTGYIDCAASDYKLTNLSSGKSIAEVTVMDLSNAGPTRVSHISHLIYLSLLSDAYSLILHL